MPGSTNSAADAALRKPSAASHASVHDLSFADADEVVIVVGINQDVENKLALSWSLLAQETYCKQDDVLLALLRAIYGDFKETYPGIERFTRYRDSLHIQDGVIMYEEPGGRAVILTADCIAESPLRPSRRIRDETQDCVLAWDVIQREECT